MSIVKFVRTAAAWAAVPVMMAAVLCLTASPSVQAAGTKLQPDTDLVKTVTEEGAGQSRVTVVYDRAAGTIAAFSSGDAAGVTARPTPGALLDPIRIELFPCGAWNNMAGTDAPLLTEFTHWSYTSPAGKTSSQTFTLDSAGRLRSTGTGTYEYDAKGQLTGIVRTAGKGISERQYGYDGQGRLISYTVTQTGAEPTAYHFTYNEQGQLIRSESDDGSRCTYRYDAEGKLAARRDYAALAGGVQERRYAYDARGRLSSVSFYNCGELEATDKFSYCTFDSVS